jgi:uncharacterized coiled-coil protein SlyX
MSRRPIGDLPRWQIVYQAMNQLGGGETLTYTRMGELLNLDPSNRKQMPLIAQAAKKAADVLRDRDRRIATVVRGHGYQLADTEQVLVLAQRHQTRAVAEVEAGATAVDTIDLSSLDATTARLVQATAMGFARQAAFMRTMDIRQQRLETTMAALETTTTHTANQAAETSIRVDQTQAELAHLRQRLAALESAPAGPPPVPAPFAGWPGNDRR